MSSATEAVSETIPAPTARILPAGKTVCPYCGAVNERATGPCPRCTMEDTPATRAATKARIGPWYVLQSRNPSAPGMKWATLLSLVNKGQISPRTIIRGPSTHQLWRFAAHTKGLSREFGMCYSCAGQIEKTANQCPHCDRLQEPPINPDALLETREPTPRSAIQREIRGGTESEPGALAIRDEETSLRDWRPDAGILSAKELAAAFQLDFRPSTTDVAPMPRKRRSLLKTCAVLLLLAGVGGTAIFYFKPEYRQPALAKVQQVGNWTRTQWNSMGSSQKPDPMKEVGRNPGHAPPPVEKVQPFQPARPETHNPPAPLVEPVPPPQPQPELNTNPYDQSRQLWRAALEAKQQGNAAQAIQLIEKIKTLPPETWPKVNIEHELDQLRQRVK